MSRCCSLGRRGHKQKKNLTELQPQGIKLVFLRFYHGNYYNYQTNCSGCRGRTYFCEPNWTASLCNTFAFIEFMEMNE